MKLHPKAHKNSIQSPLLLPFHLGGYFKVISLSYPLYLIDFEYLTLLCTHILKRIGLNKRNGQRYENLSIYAEIQNHVHCLSNYCTSPHHHLKGQLIKLFLNFRYLKLKILNKGHFLNELGIRIVCIFFKSFDILT